MSEQETQVFPAIENGVPKGLFFTEDERGLLLNMLENVSFPSPQAKVVAAGIQVKLESQDGQLG